MVEHFFTELTGNVIRAGSSTLAHDLVRDVNTYLAARNAAPIPYVWKGIGAATWADWWGSRWKHGKESRGMPPISFHEVLL